ncbi:tyrosine-type recombinase/integrase [Desulfocastanea catecholica]
MNTDTSMQTTVDRYIVHKRNLGCVFRTEEFLLRSFAAYVDRHAPCEPLTIKLALEWATAPGTGSRAYYAKRLNVLRSFARYLAVSEPATQVPPTGILGASVSRIEPYIYTPEEVVTLMQTARERVTSNGLTNQLRNATLIGLLACTGMRVGETLALDNADVDFEERLINVRNSKNLALRLVPITACTARRLQEYQQARDERFGPGGPHSAFFVSARGGRLCYSSFQWAFAQIRTRTGLEGTAKGHSPRIHDLRHTFACNHLLRAYRDGLDIDAAVQDLARYLGHANLAATYYYLTAVPALFEECTKRLLGHIYRNGDDQ